MNTQKKRLSFILVISLAFTMCLVFSFWVELFPVASQDVSDLRAFYLVTPVSPFLYPMYPGTAQVGAILDHKYPNPTKDGTLVAYNGEAYRCYDNPTPTPGYCSDGGSWMQYDSHAGNDYDVKYVPVFAAADSTHVIAAGWNNPQYHDAICGLYVKLGHKVGTTISDNFYTAYCHLSVIAVSVGESIDIKHGDIIGMSGNTGNSSGPHIHFQVSKASTGKDTDWHTIIDPYGWQPVPSAEVTTDPLEQFGYQQQQTLWIVEPDVSEGSMTLPSGAGNALPLPTIPTSGVNIDDYAYLWTPSAPPPPTLPNFQTSSGCWKASSQVSGSYNEFYLYYDTNSSGCWAKWYLPTEMASGKYDVYVHMVPIVSVNPPRTDSALYEVYANNSKVAEILVNQRALGEDYLTGTPNVQRGWIYIGNYQFT